MAERASFEGTGCNDHDFPLSGVTHICPNIPDSHPVLDAGKLILNTVYSLPGYNGDVRLQITGLLSA